MAIRSAEKHMVNVELFSSSINVEWHVSRWIGGISIFRVEWAVFEGLEAGDCNASFNGFAVVDGVSREKIEGNIQSKQGMEILTQTLK